MPEALITPAELFDGIEKWRQTGLIDHHQRSMTMRKSKLLASVIFMIALIFSVGSLFAQQRDSRGWGMGPGMMGPGWGRGMTDEEWGMGPRGMM